MQVLRLEATWERQDLESTTIDALYWGRAELVSAFIMPHSQV
jgi:hypothetical protein